MLTKAEYIDLWNRGLLGNKLRSWVDYESLMADPTAPDVVNMRHRAGYSGTVGIQYGICKSDVPAVMRGLDPASIYFNEPAPDDILVTQGELMRSLSFYDLTYNEAKIKMRAAMQHPKCMSGHWNVVKYLKPKMTNSSWEDLMDLFDQHPDVVVEFGVYEKCLGHLPGRNMVVWGIGVH